MEILTREDLIIKQADKVTWGIGDYLKEVNNQLNNEEFYHELSTNLFEDHTNSIIN